MGKNKYVRKSTHRKKIFIIAAVLTVAAAVLLAIIFTAHYQGISGKNAIVFSVDSEPVSRAEFLNIMSGLRAEVFQYFVEKYNAEDSTAFWTTGFNGEIPLEVLKRKTLEKLKRIKAEQILLKKNGIAGDISYAGFLQAFKAENQRRKKALEKNEPVYGPEQYEETVYYDVLHGNRVEKLKNKLANEKYAELVDSVLKKAKIIINEDVYKHISR